MNIVSNVELLVALKKVSSISADDQAIITLFHSLVENAVKGHLKYDPTYQQHIVILPIQSKRQMSNRLILPHVPIRRVTEVIEDTVAYGGQNANAFTSTNGATTLTAGSDYFVRYPISGIGGTNGLASGDSFCKSGILQRIAGCWPKEPGSIKVTYYAGYTAEEFRGNGTYHTAGELKMAVIQTLVHNFQIAVNKANTIEEGRQGNLVSENMGDYSYTIDGMSAALNNFSVVFPPTADVLLSSHRHYGLIGV